MQGRLRPLLLFQDGETALPERVIATPQALELITKLETIYGPIMFHQSGGCCDGSAPMCFRVGEFKLGGVDEKVGEIAGCEYWMDRDQFRRWAHTQWTVDVVPGRGASFSLEAPLNKRFLIRSSLCAGSLSTAESSTATSTSPSVPLG